MTYKVTEMSYHLLCPWCSKGETLSDGRAKVTISVQCRKCGNTYLADLDTLMTEKAKQQRRKAERHNRC